VEAIRTEKLTKRFAKKRHWRSITQKLVEAVSGVSLTIKTGELFGLLGPNGAGKTTLVKCLSTLLLPDEGTASVLGYEVTTDPLAVRRSLGVMTGGERALYWKLSARDNLRYFGALYGLWGRKLERRIDEILEIMGLRDRENDRVERYSSGMRQKVSLARAMLHDPQVLLLDEPTLGLDPQFARFIREFIHEELNRKQGKTILLTTHYMDEADQLCDRVAFMNKGEIATVESPSWLKQRMPTERLLEFRCAGSLVTEELQLPESVATISLHSADGISVVKVQAHQPEQVMGELIDRIREHATILSVKVTEPTLEDVFIHLTGDRLVDEASVL
jgi:ABC-2 type transport system ATP-binding protein